MRLTCPNCGARYEVDDALIPPEGRDVQCSDCATTWFQAGPRRPVPEPTAARPPFPPPSEAPEPEREPEPEPEPQIDEAEAFAGSAVPDPRDGGGDPRRRWHGMKIVSPIPGPCPSPSHRWMSPSRKRRDIPSLSLSLSLSLSPSRLRSAPEPEGTPESEPEGARGCGRPRPMTRPMTRPVTRLMTRPWPKSRRAPKARWRVVAEERRARHGRRSTRRSATPQRTTPPRPPPARWDDAGWTPMCATSCVPRRNGEARLRQAAHPVETQAEMPLDEAPAGCRARPETCRIRRCRGCLHRGCGEREPCRRIAARPAARYRGNQLYPARHPRTAAAPATATRPSPRNARMQPGGAGASALAFS